MAKAVAQNRGAAAGHAQKLRQTTLHEQVKSRSDEGPARGWAWRESCAARWRPCCTTAARSRQPRDPNKPEKLTNDTSSQAPPVDGAESCVPRLNPPQRIRLSAFEQPRATAPAIRRGIEERKLNIATTLCGISDVYDAMRSQRVYQQAFPTDRILGVLQRNDGKQFDQNLVRRFVQLVGIYPAGNLVRLDTSEIAVVVKTYAPDPYRPRVKVLLDADRTPLTRPYEINLWETHEGLADSVQAPVDPADYNLDPLTHI